jgi:Arc/MetJ family transcription regulator
MRTTVTIDDKLMESAIEISGITDKAALLKAALNVLIHHEASRRLALLGGSEPGIKAAPRRRFPPTRN